MVTRHEYRLELSHFCAANAALPATPALRNPTHEDADTLAALMLDAYIGTIDYDGETLEDSKAEINRLLSGAHGDFLSEHSWLCSDGDEILSACLVCFWPVRQVPLIGYVFTSAQAKGRGLAHLVLNRSLRSLAATGYQDVHAFITEGNTPSERLHRKAGFAVLPYYHWQICPAVIHQQVTGFVDQIKQLLGNDLVGAYLHGSMSFGCFNPNRSDIDLLVVTEQLMSTPTKRSIAELLLATSNHPSPFEISFLTRSQLQPWQHPTPFDFHYSEAWREKTSQELASGTWQAWQPNNTTVTGDIDLAGHITVINERGIVLAGAAIADVFPAVPPADYRDSILNDVESALAEIEKNPVYTILNTCRTLGWLQDSKIRSKDTGGIWALQHLPTELQPTVRQALETYRSPEVNTSGEFTAQELQSFATYSLAQLQKQ
ncbi:MAG: GNAT family N-acetyltransferase [Caldilineaceae bacterium]